MTSSRLVVQRYTELLSTNELEAAFNYLAEDVIYVTWLGVVEGKDNVVTFLRDNIRYMHHNRNFDRWQQVQHCLDAELVRPRGGAAEAVFDGNGYDAQGYATFERDGTVSKHLRLSLERIRVKETIVIRDGKVVLVTVMEQL